ncbi:hypothetical protein IV203_016937 [Nitzschia inconspicua]|uniref:Uncharacterized protein n=1 Tax=Nitzschia inconspicua TaxID=303405 RepID=A0A9K3KRL3_9STRA|nr:hypothetical protein IV203_016937 [Nitzschia inconspicua]
MADSSEPENETSAQELMALMVPKSDGDDHDEDEEDVVGNETSAFMMNDTASSIGDAVAAVLADAAGEDDDDETGEDEKIMTEEGPSDLNLSSDGPDASASTSVPGLRNQDGSLMIDNNISNSNNNSANMYFQQQPRQHLQETQQPIQPDVVVAATAFPNFPPNFLQQAGNAAALAAAFNPYLLAAAAGGFSLAAQNNNLVMQQPQQLQQQQQQLDPQFQVANPAFLLAAGLNSSLLLPQQQQQQQQVASAAATALPAISPNSETGGMTISPAINNSGFFQVPMQQPQQPQQFDPGAFLRAALLMQNGTMMLPGALTEQVVSQGIVTNSSNNSMTLAPGSNDTETVPNSSVTNINMVSPNNAASLFPVTALQQLVPILGGVAPVAAPQQIMHMTPQQQPFQQQQQQLLQQAGNGTSLPQSAITSEESDQQRAAIPLYLDHDESCLTSYQCFLRKQIELFEAGDDELQGTAQGRNTPLHRGQIGIRCRHCAHLPKAARARGGVYYSRTIDGVYQVAQNMSKLHFLKSCNYIPESTKTQLKSLQSQSSRASGGKEYWAEGLRVLGVVEDTRGFLKFQGRSAKQD